MVETRLACTTRCQESQVDTERSNDRFGVSWPTASDLIEDDASHRGSIILASIAAEHRQHSGDQALVAFHGHHRQSPVPQEPIAKKAEGRRYFDH
jgi:hypothetical protein